MSFLITNTIPAGEQIVGYLIAEVPPPTGATPVELVPLPNELSGYATSWVDAVNKGLASFFLLNSNLTASLLPVDSWYIPPGFSLDGRTNLVFNRSGIDTALPGNFIPFFEDAYATFETAYTFTWEQANSRALTLKVEMTPDLNDYLISGTALTPVFGSLSSVLNDLELNYTTPYDAVVAMSNGLTGLATLLGETWPPTDPYAGP